VSSLPRFSGRVVCLTRRLPASACGAVKPWSDRTRAATRRAGLDRFAAWVPTMQPKPGTPPARDGPVDIDDRTATRPASPDTTRPDRDQGPQTARPRASARPGPLTALTTDSWFDLAGDMRLRRPRGTSPESGPHLFRRARRVAAPTVHTDHLADRRRSRRPPPRVRAASEIDVALATDEFPNSAQSTVACHPSRKASSTRPRSS
jgi:hypothetical protein